MMQPTPGPAAEPQPSPDLESATDEITAVLQKYDLAGTVAVTDSQHTRYAFNLATKWSVITVGRNGEVRVDRGPKDFSSAEAYRKAIDETLIGFNSLGEHLAAQARSLAGVIQMVHKKKPQIIVPQKGLTMPRKMNGS